MKESQDKQVEKLEDAVIGGDIEVGGVRVNGATINGKRFSARFIEPGLVSYEERNLGISLLRKETIDKYLDTIVGKPVTIEHPRHMGGGERYNQVGKIDMAEYSAKDGWYWCGGELTDDKAVELVNSGHSVSCGYTIPKGESSLGKGGRRNRVRYDNEITNLHFDHLAIVTNPRYEEAGIRLNSVAVDDAVPEDSPMTKDQNNTHSVSQEEIEEMRQRLNSAVEQAKVLAAEVAAFRKNEEDKVIKPELTPTPAPATAVPTVTVAAPVVAVASVPAAVLPTTPQGDVSDEQAKQIKAAVDAALATRMPEQKKPDYMEMLRAAQYRVPEASANPYFGTREEQLARGRAMFSKA